MKRIVICCDGTWNKPGGAETNVQRIWKAIAPPAELHGLQGQKEGAVSAFDEQYVFYESGVGTSPFTPFRALLLVAFVCALALAFAGASWLTVIGPIVAVFVLRLLWAVVPAAVGAGIEGRIISAYAAVVDHYEPGCDLYLFGFSRGAFTARSTVGMIRKCGILRADARGRLREAYKLYRNGRILPDDKGAQEFRREYAVLRDAPTPIHFLGVWDTVGALGLPVNRVTAMIWRTAKGIGELVAMVPVVGRRIVELADLTSQAVQAVPLLGDFIHWFMPGYYQFHDVALSRSVANAYHALAIDEHRRSYAPTLWEQHPAAGDQKLEQRWFAGVHADIGGGIPGARQPDRALRWLAARAQDAGLAFTEGALPAEPPVSDPPAPVHKSLTGIFRILGAPFTRDVGQGVSADLARYFGGASNETVDAELIRRQKLDAGYHPGNIVAYYRAHPEVYAQHIEASPGD